MDLKDYLSTAPRLWARTPSTTPVWSGLPTAWYWTLPGMGHPQLLWATCSSASPPHNKEIFLISNLNFSSFGLQLYLPLSHHYLPVLKVTLPLFYKPLLVLKSTNEVSQEPSVIQAEQPQVSQSVLHKRGAPALSSVSWPCSGLTPTGPCPLSAGDPRVGCSTLREGCPTRAEQRDRIPPLALLAKVFLVATDFFSLRTWTTFTISVLLI